MTTYTLPEWMGGLTCRLHAHFEELGTSSVDVDNPDCSWTYRVTVPTALLTKVKTPLTEEPPNGTVISNGVDAWIRCHDENDPSEGAWFLTGNKQSWTWEEMQPGVLGAEWKRYVPDPVASAPELPFRIKDVDGNRVVVEQRDRYPGAWVDINGQAAAMETDDAEQVALAILRAAREARATS